MKTSKNLNKVDQGYKLLEAEIKREAVSPKGEMVSIPVLCDKKRITVRYLLNSSGEEWFDDTSFKAADFFVEHDSGDSREEGLSVVMAALKKAGKTDHSLPVILEDTRLVFDEDSGKEQRKFDVELFGNVERVSGIYGHRDEEVVDEENKKTKKVVKTERGQAVYTGAAVLKFHPKMTKARPEIIDAIFTTEIVARLHGWNGEESGDNFKKIIIEGEKPAQLLAEINPHLADGFTLRQLAAVLNGLKFTHIETMIGRHFSNAPHEGFKKVADFISLLEQKLSNNKELAPIFPALKKILADKEKAYAGYATAQENLINFRTYVAKHKQNNDSLDVTAKKLLETQKKLDKEWEQATVFDRQELVRREVEINHRADKIFDAYSTKK